MYAAMAIRLLLLTGCRKSEILNLHWDHVDLEAREMRLPDSKTAPRTVQLSSAAAVVLGRVPRVASTWEMRLTAPIPRPERTLTSLP